MSDPAISEPDPAVLCAERQLRLLEEMADFGMGLIRGLTAGEAGTNEAFVSVSRAVRLTFALETKTHKELRALRGEIIEAREVSEAEAAEAARMARERAGSRRKSEVRRLVLAVAESESESLEEFTETWDRLEEKLDSNGLYRSIGDWKTRYAVERLCEDLGLDPSWDYWTGDTWDERYLRPHPRWSRDPGRRAANAHGASTAPALSELPVPVTVSTANLRSPSSPSTSPSQGEASGLGIATVDSP